jgi:hypothetical protein
VGKNSNIKMIMTEEMLDDWEAQTLNIPYEKLVRHKKTLKNVIQLQFYLIYVAGGAREAEEQRQNQAYNGSAVVAGYEEV